jgi:DNA-binding SARP family transcriptional activator/tetratricopeptide (TPR) repeat protein
MLSDYRKDTLHLAPVLGGVYLERPRLYPTAHRQSPHVLLLGLGGSGKTVAAHQYLAYRAQPTVYVHLQRDDLDAWSALPEALAAAGFPAAHPRAAIQAIREPVTVFVDRLEAGLDDDGIPSPITAGWLALLLHHPFLHVVLASRVFPADEQLLMLAAAGDVHTIDGEALAFTTAEVRALWQTRHGTELAPAWAETLVVRSGGLAALVALACAAGMPPNNAASFEDVLVAQTLRSLPSELRDLLPDLAVLDTITPAALEAFGSWRPGTQALRLLRQYGTLTADVPPQLHPLLRHASLEQLRGQPRRFLQATQRAIDVALHDGAYERAWQHAVDAECWNDARRVLATAAPHMRQAGATARLITWIERLPATYRDEETLMLLAQCQEEIGDLDGALLTVTALEAQARLGDDQRTHRIWLATIQQARGDIATAHMLVKSYLHHASLPPRSRAHVYRIHAIAQALAGLADEARNAIAQSISAAVTLHDQSFLARLYQDQATIAGRVGELGEAEQALRLAERCWRDQGNPPALAGTLNARAMLTLALGDYDTANGLAHQARAHALAGGRYHTAAIASATCGDVAFAQAQYAEALLHYEVATEDAERSSDWSTRAYSLAWRVHSARLGGDTQHIARLLPVLLAHPAESSEDAAWLATGIAAAHMALGDVSTTANLEHALQAMGPVVEEVRVALLIVLSQLQWHRGEHAQARMTWDMLEDVARHPRGHVFRRLVPLATAEPALLDAVVDHAATPFAQAARALLPRQLLPTRSNVPQRTRATLEIRVLGDERAWWHGEPVTLPAHGMLLLLLLLTAPGPVAEHDLLRAIWGEDAVAPHALRKLVVRLHAVMPQLIRRAMGQYAVALPRAAIDLDLWQVLDLDVANATTDELVTLARAGSTGNFAATDAPWATELRRRVNRRVAAIWLEIGRRAEAGDVQAQAYDAWEHAQQADPTSDIVARAVLGHARRIGDRALLIQRYLHYQHALDDLLGVDPANDLQALYREALEP